MNITNRTLDALMRKYGITSDYGLAKLLQVTRGSLSNWRNEKSQMADAAAIRAATLLDQDPGELLAHLQEERAEDEDTKRAWRQIAGRLRKTAAVLTIGIAGILGLTHTQPAKAAGIEAQSINIMVSNVVTNSDRC